MKHFILTMVISTLFLHVSAQDTIRVISEGHSILKIDNKSLQLSSQGKGTLIGWKAGVSTPLTDHWNTFIGYETGRLSSSGLSNTFVGAFSGKMFNIGGSNSYFGVLAGEVTTGSGNTFLGASAGRNGGSGSFNNFIGINAGDNNTGTHNISIGRFAGQYGSGSKNIALGQYSLPNQASVSELIAIGDSSLFMNGLSGSVNPFKGQKNIAIGTGAMKENRDGFFNVTLGYRGMQKNNTGSHNVALGSMSMYNSTLGSSNTAVGSHALRNNNSGSNNVVLGYFSGFSATGSQNIYLGSNSGFNNSGSNNVFIGFSAGQNYEGNNKLIIENSNSNTPLVYGNFQDDSLKIHGHMSITGNTGIGVTEPAEKLHVVTSGISESAVKGESLFSLGTSYGGWFLSSSESGSGVRGVSAGINGKGVEGIGNAIGPSNNYGGYFKAYGASGTGVYAQGTTTTSIGIHAVSPNIAALIEGKTEIKGSTHIEGKLDDGELYLKSLNGSDGAVLRREQTTEDVYIGDLDGIGDKVVFQSAPGEQIHFLKDGRVGVGLDNPVSKFAIDDDSRDPFEVMYSSNTALKVYDNLGVTIGTDAAPPQAGIRIKNLESGGLRPVYADGTGALVKKEIHTTTRRMSFGPESFIIAPIVGGRIAMGPNPPYTFIQGVQLPDGVKIVGLKINFDDSGPQSDVSAELHVKNNSTGNPVITYVVNSTGTPGQGSDQDTFSHVVDNETMNYALHIERLGPIASPDIVFINSIVIIYQE